MPRLSEVLAAIMVDLSTARQMADAEMVRIAKCYQKNELLRGMSIPRIRIPELTIDIPVLVQSVDSEPGSQAIATSSSIAEVAARPEVETARRAEPTEDSFAILGADVLRRVNDSSDPARAVVAKPAQVPTAISEQTSLPHTLNVMVATDELLAKGTAMNITRLKLSIREDSVEWDDDGSGNDGSRSLDEPVRVPRLIPE